MNVGRYDSQTPESPPFDLLYYTCIWILVNYSECMSIFNVFDHLFTYKYIPKIIIIIIHSIDTRPPAIIGLVQCYGLCIFVFEITTTKINVSSYLLKDKYRCVQVGTER